MAYADYRLCDVCGGKTFYDANLNYDQGADVEGSVRNSGVLLQHTRLDYLGDWCVICQECARTHECRVVQKDGHATAQAGLHGEAEARAERLAEALRKLEEREQRDEALLRQALQALESGAWDTLRGRNAAYAIRERLGLEQETGND